MAVGTYVQPDFQTQTGTGYKTNLDNAISVSAIAGKWFAPHEASPPGLSVVVDKGRIYDPYQAPSFFGPGPVTVSFVAPTTNPRIDRLAIDPKTGTIVHHQGPESATPPAPGIPADELPCAKVALSVGMSEITNQEITDERVLNRVGLGNAAGQDHAPLSKAAAYTVQLADHGKLILCNTAGGSFTVTLPDPAVVGTAFVVTVKRTLSGGGNAVTVVSAGGAPIDGAASVSIGEQLDAVTFVSGAADWFVRGSERLRDGQVTKAKIANDAVDLAKIAHATQGDLLYWAAGGAPAVLGAGTAGQVLTTQGAGGDPVWADDVFGAQLLHVRDEKAGGINGGDFVSGAWRTRVLNTVATNEIAGASLAVNQVTLPVGEYFLIARAPARSVSKHKLLWRNVTDAVNVLHGTTSVTQSNSAVETHGNVSGRFTVSGASKAFELQHFAEVTRNIDGLGSGANFRVPEVFAEIFLWKIG